MKIRLLSDLHHEHFDGRRQLPELEADVVVLAGDIHSHLEGLHWARETFADSEIVYVAGNHEFYSSEMTDLTQAMRNIARALEIHFLENDEARIGPARFLGATLWTDFQLYGADGYAPAHELALQSMPDFSCIDWFGGDFTPEQSIALHRASRDWLAEQLARPRRPDAGGQPPRAQCAVDPAAVRRQPAVASLRFQPRRTGGAGRLLAARSRPRCPRLPHRPGTGAGQSGRLSPRERRVPSGIRLRGLSLSAATG